MDLKQLEKLMAAMERMGMKRLVIKEEGIEIELERETPFYAMGSLTLPPMAQPLLPQAHPSAPASPAQALPPPSEAPAHKFITSPMVGTFYTSSSPGSPPLAKVGDKVNEKSVVGIIEAMKVMNEIKAGIQGEIAEVLIKNGQPVDFGTKIFRIV